MKYLEMKFSIKVVPHSLRIRYQPSEDTMMVDISTIQSLELVQNNGFSKSNDCFFGFLDKTRTPMGSRMLKSNILQPSTLPESFIEPRYEALEELASDEDMYSGVQLGQTPPPIDSCPV
jgi:DNA mismatch repair protein MSH4